MFRCFLMLLVGLACLSGFVALGQDKPAIGIRGWGEVVDPDKDCQIRVDGRKVVVTVPDAAHDFAGELKRWNAPRILTEVKGEFIIDVKVSGEFKPTEGSNIETRRGYNGAGILLIKDKNNHLSLQRGAVNLDGKIRHYLNFELRKDAELATSLYEIDLEDAATYLRLERRGQKVYGMGSKDGINWKSYDPIDVDFPEVLTAGVEVINSSKSVFSCAFEDFAIFRKVKDKPIIK